MKVTVCELRNDPIGLEQDWEKLVEHVLSEKSDLVLLDGLLNLKREIFWV